MFSKADVEAYFNGEKQETLWFMIIGLIAILSAIFLFFYVKQHWAKGAAIPVMVIGIIQLMVGYTVYNRSDEQRKDIVYKMDMNPDALEKQEVPRMEKVMKNFVVFRYTEICLVLAGLILVLVFKSNPDKQLWFGVGAGLALQAAIMLLADGLAERRGEKYLSGMKTYLEALHNPG